MGRRPFPRVYARNGSTRLHAVSRPRVVIALIAGLATLAVGCGAEGRDEVSFSGAEAQVADVVTDLQEASEQEEPTRICRALVAEPLQGDDCEAKVRQAIDDADQFSLDVREVTVNGTNATARVITGSGDAERTATMRFVRQGSNWRVTSFG